MADILKISTPLVERLPVETIRPGTVADSSLPFDLSNVTRVMQPQNATELLEQNTGFVPKENETPTILADLLKDPAVTATMIRNITMLQEVFTLMPAANEALTTEIQQMFEQLMLSPEGIVPELELQQANTTLFKGELFDQLRELLTQAQTGGAKPQIATDIGVLLKGLNAALSRRDVLNSVANNLSFLATSLDASPRLSEKLDALIQAFRAPEAPQEFQALKQQAFSVLKEIENSVLFTPKMEKTLPLVVYNLSRYNDNDDFLPDAFRLLLNDLDGDALKEKVTLLLQDYVNRFQPGEGAREARAVEDDSKVVELLAKIIGRHAHSEDAQLVSGDKLEKIVQSMLSSPSNFTPLLHFIVPVEYMDTRAFGEIWIDPNAGDENGRRNAGEQGVHMLMVFDVESIGRFESELYVQANRIALNLLCPPAYLEDFKGIAPGIREAVEALGYSFDAINIDRLERTHSLMEVFTDLPHRRLGIDVKI